MTSSLIQLVSNNSRAIWAVVIASRADGVGPLKDAIDTATVHEPGAATLAPDANPNTRYAAIDDLLEDCLRSTPTRRSFSDRLDAIVLNRYLALRHGDIIGLGDRHGDPLRR